MKKYILFLAIAALLLYSCSPAKRMAAAAPTSIETLLADSALTNAHTGVYVYNPTSQKVLYSYQSDKYFVPASNTKLFSCYAGMKYLGDSLTGVLFNDSIGELRIIGNGDPTFLHPDFENQPVFNFIKNTKSKEILLCQILPANWPFQESFNSLGKGWSWDDYNSYYMAERSFFPIYGNIARFTLKQGLVDVSPSYFKKRLFNNNKLKTSFDVERERETNAFFVKEGSNKNVVEVPIKQGMDNRIVSIEVSLLVDTLKRNIQFVKTAYSSLSHLKRIHSQPTDSLLKPMMHRSDNFFAEQTLLMVSNEKLGYMNDRTIIDTLLKTDLKDLPQKPVWVDGSGLSRYNLFTPQCFVKVLEKMKDEFGMERMKNILPTGGEGTLSSLYKPITNQIFAKTGTLSGQVALSGYLFTKNNTLLIFSILVNNHNNTAGNVRKAVEKFVMDVWEKE
jgi:serine-type D-Ala-D-Ala carboxypeptidase/endopeptidase (penicillin-binding protein 4)